MTRVKKTLALNSDGDIDIDDADRSYFLEGAQSIIQQLKIRLLTIRGEDPFDPDYGLRVFEITGAPNAVLEREIRFTLNEDERVSSVENIQIDGDPGTRQREVSITVELESGVVETFEVNT